MTGWNISREKVKDWLRIAYCVVSVGLLLPFLIPIVVFNIIIGREK